MPVDATEKILNEAVSANEKCSRPFSNGTADLEYQ